MAAISRGTIPLVRNEQEYRQQHDRDGLGDGGGLLAL